LRLESRRHATALCGAVSVVIIRGEAHLVVVKVVVGIEATSSTALIKVWSSLAVIRVVAVTAEVSSWLLIAGNIWV
jgi:hypothetical protein